MIFCITIIARFGTVLSKPKLLCLILSNHKFDHVDWLKWALATLEWPIHLTLTVRSHHTVILLLKYLPSHILDDYDLYHQHVTTTRSTVINTTNVQISLHVLLVIIIPCWHGNTACIWYNDWVWQSMLNNQLPTHFCGHKPGKQGCKWWRHNKDMTGNNIISTLEMTLFPLLISQTHNRKQHHFHPGNDIFSTIDITRQHKKPLDITKKQDTTRKNGPVTGWGGLS